MVLDPGPERVADGTAEQTAAHPAAEVLLFRAPPDGAAARCAHHALPKLTRFLGLAPSGPSRSTVIDRN
ncbi:sulfate transporter [Streptomyces sp. NBRC 110611]|nr:sulfate transporter [Streptomyces sp. NBRC 110611]